MCWMACVLEGSGRILVALRMCPKYCISFEKKLHLLFFMDRLVALSFSNTKRMCERCSCGVLLNMIMSSRYAMEKREILEYACHQLLEVSCACASPKGTLMYSYFPKGKLKAVLGMDDSSRGMWWYPAWRSKVVKYVAPSSLENISSTLGMAT